MVRGRIYSVHYGESIYTTRSFIESVLPFLDDSLELTIINNSKEIDISYLCDSFIYVINADKNLGYFGGIKFGIEKLPIDALDYIIICNNDIQISNSDFFSILKEKLNCRKVLKRY